MSDAPARRPLVVGNWKMHKTIAETRALVRELRTYALPAEIEVAIAPPFTALAAACDELRGCAIELAAQTMHESGQGAFTGEISPGMLQELDVRYVILGHSERRAFCDETDAGVNRKVRSALAYGIVPIVAVGESAAERAAGQTRAKVTTQVRAAFEGLDPADVARCVVAYEPLWAIGSGLADEPAATNAVLGELRSAVAGLDSSRLLYGGSMKGDNAAALMAQPNIDGGLIGGASLAAGTFAAVIDAAAQRAPT